MVLKPANTQWFVLGGEERGRRDSQLNAILSDEMGWSSFRTDEGGKGREKGREGEKQPPPIEGR